MEDLSVQFVNLEEDKNQASHQTQDFSSASLVVRRGAPFKVTLLLGGRAFNPQTDTLIVKALLGRLHVTMPVTFSQHGGSSSKWRAYFSPEGLNHQNPSLYIQTPASASVGKYSLQLYVLSHSGQRGYLVGDFILLCNPFCKEDAVYIPSETQREEYVQNDFGMLYMGTPKNTVSRPWSFDQYEPEILEICLQLLQVSPQHSRNWRKDYLRRSDPVYISRVVSAMINCQDDRGVLQGNWSGDYKQGVAPSKWTGSSDILQLWAKSQYRPVKYGQCWVFAAVMCTVMRVLGIPCRVVTNFNSAHDTNANLVIEEYYSETGKKLPQSKDSIWNFHVWVECWMTRPDLGSGFDGWQVLDPTPQEKSRGVYCCGPASVKAIRDKRVDLYYDIPFVYAEVNADVQTVITRQGQVVSYSVDTERVGSFICTKSIGSPRLQNITGDYKHTKAPTSSERSKDSINRRGSPQGLSVSLSLVKVPVDGESISFTVTVTNMTSTPKVVKAHVNAQAKEYNSSPSDTFWESQSVIRIAPYEAKVIDHQIAHSLYESTVGDDADMVNLAVVLKDMETQEVVMASEEFNIGSPQINIQITNKDSILQHEEQTAVIVFTNPFFVPVSGLLAVSGSGLLEEKVYSRIHLLKPGGSVVHSISFTPRKVGTRMLHATLALGNKPKTVIRGFQMVSVQAA